jgi:hypothetical protein
MTPALPQFVRQQHVLAGICVLSAFAAEKNMMRALLDEHQAEACAFIGQVGEAKSPVSG